MAQTVIVDAVVRDKTHIGKINFPVNIPEGLATSFRIPDDMLTHAHAMGLQSRHLQFLLGATRGRWAMTVELDLPALAPKLGMSFAELDEIIRDLLEKGYAQMGPRLNLFRYWIVVLHLKGVRYDVR